MRDVGYGNEGQALMDIIDNGIEGSQEIHVLVENDGLWPDRSMAVATMVTAWTRGD